MDTTHAAANASKRAVGIVSTRAAATASQALRAGRLVPEHALVADGRGAGSLATR
jgi:hypothetical protein